MVPRHDRWQWLKETVCFFWGHSWKSSWRQRGNRDELLALDYHRSDRDKVPYAQRMSGNPLCEFSAGWHYRCRRCRHRTRDSAWLPWWRDFWCFSQSFCSSWWIGVTAYWTGYHWSARCWSLISAPLFAWEQAYIGWAWSRRWPFWPGIWAGDLNHSICMRIEHQDTQE